MTDSLVIRFLFNWLLALCLLCMYLLSGCAGGDEAVPPGDTAKPQESKQEIKPKDEKPAPVLPTEKPKDEPKPIPVVTEPPPPPAPNMVTLAFTGTLGGNRTAEGTFTYEATQGPSATNLYTLQNVGYLMTSWNMTVSHADLDGVVSVVDSYRNDTGGTVEFCEGQCIFAGGNTLKMTFKNGGTMVLILAFDIVDPTPSINPPSTFEEWGTFRPNSSSYRVPNAGGALIVFFTGTLSAEEAT